MNPLEEVLEWYEVACESHTAVAHALDNHPDSFPENSIFALQSTKDWKELILKTRTEIDDLTVVSLVSIFEQIVIDHLQAVVDSTINQIKDSFAHQVLENRYRLYPPERWRFVDILDLFKTEIDPRLVGEVKESYKYRSWVAHGRRQLKPPTVHPYTAYDCLTDFLNTTGLMQR